MSKDAEEKRAVDLLKELNDAVGVSGDEGEIAALLEKRLAPVTDEHYIDTLGNAVFVKKGRNPDLKIMIAAHMDEIGFMVLDATKTGYVTVVPVGFHDPNILVNQYLTILTGSGPVYGVIGAGKPVHQTYGSEPKPYGFKDIEIDVGARTSEEVAEMGIRPGDFAVIEKQSRHIGKHLFSGKSVDNRSGCAAMVIAMEELAKADTECTVYACGTVQEEIGLKGADVLIRGIDPQYALCLDVGFATLDGKPDQNTSRMYLGDGPGIELYDWSPSDCTGNIVPKKVVRALEEAAKAIGIKHQYSLMLNGGTDAAVMTYANNGVLTAGISIPQRYMHTTVGVIDIRDMIGAGKLTAQYVKSIAE